MSKNAEGWIRHRGGKCPVEVGTMIDIRCRDGLVRKGVPCGKDFTRTASMFWSHEGDGAEVMAYRLHKTVDQVEACSKPDPRDSAKRDSDYVCWMRDRITEIDATTQALTTKRAELVQRLASEGFALIGRINDLLTDSAQKHEDMSDWRNIQIGDLVSVISIGGFSDRTGLSVGDIVEVTSVDNDETIKTVSCGSWGYIGYNYKFHSRPSA